MNRSRALCGAVTVVAMIGVISGPATTPVAAEPAPCTVSGPAEQYAPTLQDFGRGGSPYIARGDPSYWGDRGYLFGFQRAEYEGLRDNPWGGYLYGGVVVSADAKSASEGMLAAAEDWTNGFEGYEAVSVPAVGDEAIAVQRLTAWEIASEQPYAEVFLAFRRCNAQVHFSLGTMPEFGPVVQALRYARLLDARMQG